MNILKKKLNEGFSLVELVMVLEEEFDIEIPDEEAEELKTFEQIVDYISKRAT